MAFLLSHEEDGEARGGLAPLAQRSWSAIVVVVKLGASGDHDGNRGAGARRKREVGAVVRIAERALTPRRAASSSKADMKM
jgi:hypothetical protein